MEDIRSKVVQLCYDANCTGSDSWVSTILVNEDNHDFFINFGSGTTFKLRRAIRVGTILRLEWFEIGNYVRAPHLYNK